MPMRPMFCAKAVYGNVLKMPPRAVEKPSARRAFVSMSSVMGLSTISLMATISPVVSAIVTSMTSVIARHETGSKIG